MESRSDDRVLPSLILGFALVLAAFILSNGMIKSSEELASGISNIAYEINGTRFGTGIRLYVVTQEVEAPSN